MAVELRKSGASYPDIARAVKMELKLDRYSVGTARNDVLSVIEDHRNKLFEDVKDLVQIELKRLDDALRAIWEKAMSGDKEAINTMLKIEDMRCKLTGLYSPTAIDLTSGGRPLVIRSIQVNLPSPTSVRLPAPDNVIDGEVRVVNDAGASVIESG